ncbi:YchJ family protein [Neisseria sp. S1]|uniref:YchJ family protein n=1 Tax=Neisseria sp. S1 TaxID=3318354 RepID=UPI003A869F94
MTTACPCQSGLPYTECCQPFHNGTATAPNAEALMRSRYCAYVLHHIDYIIDTTVPAQQPLLDRSEIQHWSESTRWQGLNVLAHHPNISKNHAQVEFKALYSENGQTQVHHELSAFVRIGEDWYFIDPTVPLPGMKHPCFCGSAKKFKACCGQFFK